MRLLHSRKWVADRDSPASCVSQTAGTPFQPDALSRERARRLRALGENHPEYPVSIEVHAPGIGDHLTEARRNAEQPKGDRERSPRRRVLLPQVEEKARRWLARPHAVLSDRSALEAAKTSEGPEQVQAVPIRIEDGMYE